MFRTSNQQNWLFLSLIALLITLLAGCAAKRQLWGDPKSGLILEYRLPEDKSLNYHFSSQMTQNMEVMGQSMENLVDVDIFFGAKSKAVENGNFDLHITVDSAGATMQTPRGDLSPDMNAISGKQFQLLLSPLGKELALNGADELTYEIQGGKRSLASNFQTIFPDLAGKPVKVGDSWTTHDTINVNEGDTNLQMTFVSENTLAGLEIIDGHECAKITGTSIGKLTGTGSERGANLAFAGDIKSSDVWYFAYKEGFFMRSLSDATTESIVTVSGPTDMEIPMTMKTKYDIKLVE